MPRLVILALLVLALFPIHARAVVIDWVPVGNPGNAPDLTGNCWPPRETQAYPRPPCGSVSYRYYISKYETTNAQYAEFLNAKAAADPHDLYNPYMGSDVDGGITQSGISGGYTYAVKAGFANKPVTWVSFYDALRFANWLDNGQGNADTETGAYTITAEAIQADSITRNPGAITFLPSEDEWYKAAYFNGTSYFAYPAGSSTPTLCSSPGATPNTANCAMAVGAATDVGAYTGSPSPYGTFDQGGNAMEFNEAMAIGFARSIRGGDWHDELTFLSKFTPSDADGRYGGYYTVGFRVASLVPEPGTALLVATGLGLLATTRGRAR